MKFDTKLYLMPPVTSSVMQLIVPACALLPVKQQHKKYAAGFHWMEKK